MNPLMHPTTKRDVDSYLAKPVHALLLEGLSGVGKGTVARYIAAELLSLPTSKLGSYPFFETILPINGTLTIEQVRHIQQFMRLKTIGQRPIRRVLIVEQSELLSVEAQNALLKTLEEPPVDSVLILTAAQPLQLLPTIRSRIRSLPIRLPQHEELISHFKADYKQSAIEKAYQLSEGRAGLMKAILSDDKEHPLLQNIQVVKDVLAKSTFERLAMIDELIKQNQSLEEFLQAWQLVCSGALHQAAKNNNTSAVKKWHLLLKKANWAEDQYRTHPNSKLLLSDLLLNLA